MSQTNNWPVADPSMRFNNSDPSQWPAIEDCLKLPKAATSNSVSTDQIKSSSNLEGPIVNQLSHLQLSISVSYDATADIRSREEILEERKLRKIQQKKDREQARLESQIDQIRAPKCDKIKIIDRREAARILNAANVQPKQSVRGESRRSRNVRFELSEFLDSNLTAKTHPSFYAADEGKGTAKPCTESSRPKGKTRELPRPKNQSQLKKNILKSREIRRDDSEATTQAAACNGDTISQLNESPNTESGRECTEFSRKFRPYCNNNISAELCDATENLLRDIFNFQNNAYNRNQIKARAHKRFVVGFKETQRQLQTDKIKLLIIAPDLEPTVTDEFGGMRTAFPFSSCRSTNKFFQTFRIRRRFGQSYWTPEG